MSSKNRSWNGGLIGFTTSFSALTMCMSANITDKGPPIVQASIYLTSAELDCTICCQFVEQSSEYEFFADRF